MRLKNEALVRDILDNPVKYARALGFTLLSEIHNVWLRKMLLCLIDFTLLAHRGSYKTTCVSVALSFLIILRPDQVIFFLRKTDDDVIEIISQVKKLLETDLMQAIVYDIYGVYFEFDVCSSYKISTNLACSVRGQVQLQGMGLNGSLTGKHADIIFTDDIVNVKDRISRAEREQTKRQYMELQNIKNRGGRIVNTGTPWHKEDAISTLMPNIHKFNVYDTGLITVDQQQQLRASMSPSLYAANYELQHIASDDALFGPPQFYAGPAADIHNGRAHIDAAYGGSDYTALTILTRKPGGGYIGYGKLWRGHVDGHLDEIQALHKLYRAGTIACEKNGDKGYLARDLRARSLPVAEYQEKENKYIKIATHLKREWPRIEWIKDTDPDYLSQILDYTETAEHDDAPDSAASLIRSYGQAGRIGNKADILYGRR